MCPLIGILGVREVLVPPNPGNVSAFGLLTVDVRIDQVRTAVSRHDALDHGAVAEIYADLEAQARHGLASQGFGAAAQRLIRTADLRYFGQAFEVRVPVRGRRRSTPPPRRPSPARSTTRTGRCTATTSAATPASTWNG